MPFPPGFLFTSQAAVMGKVLGIVYRATVYRVISYLDVTKKHQQEMEEQLEKDSGG